MGKIVIFGKTFLFLQKSVQPLLSPTTHVEVHRKNIITANQFLQQLNVDLVKVKNLQNIFFPINSSFKVKKKSLSKIWNPFIRKCLGIGTYMVLVYVFYRDSGGKHYLEQR